MKQKNCKGITLIALVITIIVILIIISIVIKLTIGTDGIISRTKRAKLDQEIGEIREKVILYAINEGIWPLVEDDDINTTIESVSLESNVFPESFIGFKEFDITKVNTLYKTINESEDNPYENQNQNQKFYIIDLEKIGLKEKYNIGSKQNGENDVFILCENTKNVYYSKGEQIGSQIYHGTTKQEEYKNTQVLFPITEPGIYKMTINAGKRAIWISLIEEGLSIPEGAKIEYSFETSEDRENWSNSVDKISSTENSQYLRVTLNLIPNELGKSPTIQSARIRFKILGEEQIISIEKGDNIEEIEDEKGVIYKLKPEKLTGEVTQTIELQEEMKIGNIQIPVKLKADEQYGNNIEDETTSVKSKIYVSKNGVDWTEYQENDENKYKYVKVISKLSRNNISDISPSVGKISINAKIQSGNITKDWIITRTEYYDADASDIGTWVSLKTEEEIPNGTKIKYSFTKSNDGINWTTYNENIMENGDSRYIKVKIEYQKASIEIKEEAKLIDIMLNFKIGDKIKGTGRIAATSKENSSALGVIRSREIKDGIYELDINNEKYNIEIYNFYDNVEYIQSPILGDTISDKTMLVLKYHKDLTINEGVKITPQVRKKGMLISVTGTLENKGEISMTARGAISVGQDVYLWKNEDNTYEYVPAIGAVGGASITKTGNNDSSGNNGIAGINRQSGGGATGAINMWRKTTGTTIVYAGATGTSYSGGSGSGGAATHTDLTTKYYGGAPGANGGAGGNGVAIQYSTGSGYYIFGGGGAGNSSGVGKYSYNRNYNLNYGSFKGKEGTGGLLIINANKIINNGSITSNGSNGGGTSVNYSKQAIACGGGSGGGSINIFYQEQYINNGTVNSAGGVGGTVGIKGGTGGTGSITTGNISTGTFIND